MKFEYPILWIDDRREFVDNLRPRLEKWFDDQGLRLVVHWHQKEEGIYEVLEQGDIEFIILDYKLKGKSTGDTVIASLRKKGYWESIFFYSTIAIPDKLFTKPPDGVYFSDKEGAFARLQDVLWPAIKRMSTLANVRGWFVADAIELENMIDALIRQFFSSHKALSKSRAIKALKEDGSFFFGRMKGFLPRILEEFVEDMACSEHTVFDFGGKHSLLSGLVKDHIAGLSTTKSEASRVAQLKGCKSVLGVFPTEIIHPRNTLAHQMEEAPISGRRRVRPRLKDGEPIETTTENCATLRKNLQKHYDNLKSLAQIL